MIFVSYSWINEKPDMKVLNFVGDLRLNGYDAGCDVMYMQNRTSINFMEMMAENLRSAEKVIIVLSEHYRRKADSFSGGVGEEYRYIINDIKKNINKYILVAFDTDIDKILPDFLDGREIIFLNEEGINKYTKLLHRLSGVDEYSFPEVNPIKTNVTPICINTQSTLTIPMSHKVKESNLTHINNTNKVVNIKIIGVGGCGNNAVNRMIDSSLESANFISINTDNQALNHSKASYKLHIGEKLTKGKGAGGIPEKGQKAAEENREEIAAVIRDANVVFIIAGMGGGTGTGAAPVVAKIARDMGILTIGLVTTPFAFEGRRRMEQAVIGVAQLKESVDALLVINVEQQKLICDQKIVLKNIFSTCDDILRQSVQSISSLITKLGHTAVESILKNSGYFRSGMGQASGQDKVILAAHQAIRFFPVASLKDATGVLVNITASKDISLDDVDLAVSIIHEQAHADVNMTWVSEFDSKLDDEMIVTVVATGFERMDAEPSRVAPNSSADISSDFDDDDDDDQGFYDIMKLFNNKS